MFDGREWEVAVADDDAHDEQGIGSEREGDKGAKGQAAAAFFMKAVSAVCWKLFFQNFSGRRVRPPQAPCETYKYLVQN